MRHGNKVNALGRKYGHRKAMMRNLASSLIINKRIFTTLAKAKELRKYVEPVITKSKTQTTASRRDAFRYLQQKEAVHELFTEVSTKVAERNGGYTRIIKMGNRLGDNAEMAMIELVDYNELYTQSKGTSAGKKSRRRRGGSKSTAQTETATAVESVVETVEETTEVTTEMVEETTDAVIETVEEVVETAEEVAEEVAETVEESVEEVVEETTAEIDDTTEAETEENDENNEAESEEDKKD